MSHHQHHVLLPHADQTLNAENEMVQEPASVYQAMKVIHMTPLKVADENVNTIQIVQKICLVCEINVLIHASEFVVQTHFVTLKNISQFVHVPMDLPVIRSWFVEKHQYHVSTS